MMAKGCISAPEKAKGCNCCRLLLLLLLLLLLPPLPLLYLLLVTSDLTGEESAPS